MTDKPPAIRSVVCVSGGMDSCVLVGLAVRDSGGPEHVAALHVNYRQRTEKRELDAFNAIADFYHITRRLVVDLPFFHDIGASALTDPRIPVPQGSSAGEGIPITYVPFRNGVILSVAVAWAESLGASRVYLGAVGTDRPGYPDCRREFFQAMNAAIDLGTRPETHLEIQTPLVGMEKVEIVQLGVSLGAPFQLTWSCYRNSERACGTCDSCRLRLDAFASARVKDPIPYCRAGSPRSGDSHDER